MEFKTLLPLRQSVRAYTEEPVTEAQIQALLTAAQAAPVCMGKVDTVKFSVVTDPADIATLNAEAGKVTGEAMNLNYSAPALIFVLASAGDEELVQGSNAGAVMSNMLLAAADEGLAAVYLFGLCKLTLSSEAAQKVIRTRRGLSPWPPSPWATPPSPSSPGTTASGLRCCAETFLCKTA